MEEEKEGAVSRVAAVVEEGKEEGEEGQEAVAQLPPRVARHWNAGQGEEW